MAKCPKCGKPGIIHYPNGICTKCVLELINKYRNIEDK